MEVSLTSDQIQQARQLAKASYNQFKQRSGYYTNTPQTHFIGKLGEIGALCCLEGVGLTCQAVFEDTKRLQECDIIVRETVRVEVKTWSSIHWDELGRCIAAGQIGALECKCDVVLWCVVSADGLDPEHQAAEESCDVRVAGWSEVSDIRDAPMRVTGYGGMPQVMNYQLCESSLRDTASLSRRLSEG